MIDLSKAGLKEGLIKALKVIGYVAASGAVTALIAELSQYEPKKEDVIAVVAVMIANAILAFLKEWLSTKTLTKSNK